MSNFGSLENGNFYGLKRIVFYLEGPQSTFSALLCIKTNKKSSNFLPNMDIFMVYKALFSIEKNPKPHI